MLYCYCPHLKNGGRCCFQFVSSHLDGREVPIWLFGWGGVHHPRSRGEGVPHPADGGGGVTPISGLDGRVPYPADRGTPSKIRKGVPPSKISRGYPHPGLDWVPPSPIRRQISIASNCYTVGGVPLAFTQEDFLVEEIFSVNQ